MTGVPRTEIHLYLPLEKEEEPRVNLKLIYKI